VIWSVEMTEVTVLFLDQTFSSTAVGPLEVFNHAGSLWNLLTGTRQTPRFKVTTASVDGRAVRCDGPIYIKPAAAIADIRKTDLIFIPTTGLRIDDVAEYHAPVISSCVAGKTAGPPSRAYVRGLAWSRLPECWMANAPRHIGR